jgi:hypothetical protein
MRGEERWHGELGRRAWLAVALVMWLIGCATTVRLNDPFDSDPLGGLPGGRWVVITPDAGFIAAPDPRHRAAVATSDPFTVSPPASIRGHLRLRLDGPGTVTVGFRPIQGAFMPDFIGGVALGSYVAPAPGQAYLVGPFAQKDLDALSPLASAGRMAPYAPGSVVDINWSIDQAARTLTATVGGGTPQTVGFPPASGGVATTPVSQLSFWIFLEKPTNATRVFVDNLYAEEVRGGT